MCFSLYSSKPSPNPSPRPTPGPTTQGFFPFRDTAFYVSVAKAQELLGFEPKHTITEDIRWMLDAENVIVT